MSSRTYHVLRRNGDWTLHKVGAANPKIFATQREAVENARKQIGNKPGQLVIHGVDGFVREVQYFKLPKIQEPPFPKSAKAKRIERAVTSIVLEPGFATAN